MTAAFRLSLAACVLFFAITGAAQQPVVPPSQLPPVADPEPPEFAGTLGAHNALRSRVGVPTLGWSGTLARQAQNWADQLAAEGCRNLRYNPDPVRRDHYGQNLFNSWGAQPYSGYKKVPREMVERWADDGQFYDPRTNSCNAPSGRQCGQYVQQVWDETRFVGCGRSRCESAEVWVCEYYPRGNRPGRRPYGDPPVAAAVAPAPQECFAQPAPLYQGNVPPPPAAQYQPPPPTYPPPPRAPGTVQEYPPPTPVPVR